MTGQIQHYITAQVLYSKIIQSEISDTIRLLKKISAWSENPYFATIGGNPLK